MPIIIVILGVIARLGIKHAIKIYGKNAVKNAAKKSVLQLNANKWTHIMAPKHDWHKLNAQGDKNRIADLIGNAMS